jgi:hypothetical protein
MPAMPYHQGMLGKELNKYVRIRTCQHNDMKACHLFCCDKIKDGITQRFMVTLTIQLGYNGQAPKQIVHIVSWTQEARSPIQEPPHSLIHGSSSSEDTAGILLQTDMYQCPRQAWNLHSGHR